MCLDNRTSGTRMPMVDNLHWAACCRLVCVEGYITTAIYITSSKHNPTLFPWLLLLLLDLTLVNCKCNSSCLEDPPEHASGSILYTGTKLHARQLQKMGEMLSCMCNDWSPRHDLLPDTYFDASAQRHVLKQLLECITRASKVNALLLHLMSHLESVLLVSTTGSRMLMSNQSVPSACQHAMLCTCPGKPTYIATIVKVMFADRTLA